MIKPWSGPKFNENSKKCRGGHQPCAICGKPIKDNKKAVMVFICCDDFQPDSVEPDHREHGNNMGSYPVGPDCARVLRKDRPEIFSEAR